ncbi:MAG: retroviral-like aspartic protease family protein [Sedimentisphaerales bacterium]|nr:retroviral-like aspartic protease family protein [Sedimentisphaerales bacterium]
MPIQEYPFLLPTKEGIKIRCPNSLPMLWIRVINPANKIAVVVPALIDTGAISCAFPASCASKLGHDLRSVPHKKIITGNGVTCAFPHTSIVQILNIKPDGNPDITKILFTINEQLIDYTEGLDAFLLGQQNFLDKFILSINYPQKKLSVRYPHSPIEKKIKIKKRRH